MRELLTTLAAPLSGATSTLTGYSSLELLISGANIKANLLQAQLNNAPGLTAAKYELLMGQVQDNYITGAIFAALAGLAAVTAIYFARRKN